MSASAVWHILAAAVVTAAANFLLRAGILAAQGFSPNSVSEAAFAFIRLLLNPLFVAGFILYFVAALIWFRTIAIAPLSIAYPMLVSATFILVTLGSAFISAEAITLTKVLGLATILVGIVIVST